LKVAASQAEKPTDLLKMTEIRPALLTASGVSDKALKFLEESDKTEAIAGLINKFLEPSGENFVEELVYRFLLTRGDTLGGIMRNVGGFLAECKLSRAVIASLRLREGPIFVLTDTAKTWQLLRTEDADIELTLRGLSWNVGAGHRTLILNLGVPLVRKNVDLCLFDCPHKDFKPAIVKNPARYVALGELKGGIDPAGADEHWKTAGSALARIKEAFGEQGLKPFLFYVGGAIEGAMAEEIWKRLTTGWLENAANLTNADQIPSLAQWLITI
jgi:type II restriction enzyme